MIRHLFIHYFKEQRRSPAFHKNLASNIAIGLMVVLLALNILFLGLFIDRLLTQIAPEEDPIETFNRVVLYYFGFELLMRIIFSKPKIQSISPYLHLPIKRSTLAHYSISRSFFSLFNFASLLIAVPFAIKVIGPLTIVGAMKWLLSIFMVSLTLALLNTFLSRQQFINPRRSLLYFGSIVFIAALDYYGLVSISNISVWFFGAVIFQPFHFLIPLVCLALIYFASYRSFKDHIYLDQSSKDTPFVFSNATLPFLDRFGEAGKYMDLELKLILRNKRARSTVLSTLLLVAICLLFYFMEDRIEYQFLVIYIGLAATGMGLLAYGQFLWESNYYDLILSRNVDFFTYCRAKYYLLILLNTGLFIFILPLGFFGLDVFLMNIALFLYNIGINTIVVMYLTTFSRKRLDLEAHTTSPQGKGTSQYLTAFPTIILPMFIIYAPLAIAGFEHLVIPAFAVIGIIGLVLHKPLLRMIVRRFKKQKYKISRAFRES